jgi:hypothetical protein
MIGIDEEGPYFRGIDPGVEFGGIALAMCIATEQRTPPAPPAAANGAPFQFDHEISAVVDQLRVDTESALQSAFDLFGSIVPSTELARGTRDQDFQGIRIGAGCGS